ncbi:cytochrome d ubiquinol oxidase subunit II [soil metagenome]
MHMPIDYPTLRIIWWILIGALLIGFAVMDGFDMGIGMLLHRVAKKNSERRLVLNTIGPVWEGNQVWLVLGAGAIFAAWPALYALSFSGFYFAMLLVLAALIVRPVGFKYRSKIDNSKWRALWDMALFTAGFVPALIFGVAIGNVLQGVPFYFDDTLRSFYTGTLGDLLNPFALLCGLLSVSMLCTHGATFLCIKTTGIIQYRARYYARFTAILTLILFAVAGWWVVYHLKGYTLVGTVITDAPSNPLHKEVLLQTGAWIANYYKYPQLLAAPLLGFIGSFLALILISIKFDRTAWLASALSIGGIIATVGVSMFPFILPSSTHPKMSLLVWDASSSHTTLFIMLIVTSIFLPIILLYTSWVYYVLRGKVTEDYISKNQGSVY